MRVDLPPSRRGILICEGTVPFQKRHLSSKCSLSMHWVVWWKIVDQMNYSTKVAGGRWKLDRPWHNEKFGTPWLRGEQGPPRLVLWSLCKRWTRKNSICSKNLTHKVPLSQLIPPNEWILTVCSMKDRPEEMFRVRYDLSKAFFSCFSFQSIHRFLTRVISFLICSSRMVSYLMMQSKY